MDNEKVRAFIVIATTALVTVLSTIVSMKLHFGFLGAWVIATAILLVGNGVLCRDRRLY